MTRAEIAPNAVAGWNVEQFDDDGACLMATFTGPDAKTRACDYAETRNDLLDAGLALADFDKNGGVSLDNLKRELQIKT